ncbi:glycosyltransferase [Altererythrobacter sp. TH136]|uniref:glycosyltransferase n=1 Tax=Altererythrobacter sp. TH136 TaxID=2067415 RepID=UPI0011633A03|nr:glycosyltransferase [Altererythrobacter sp. TH136]QDM41008.1 glycosyltransferase [Altererythrobacter sp. TH136]
MNVLLVHQNFPGQFKHLAPALASRGNRVEALTFNQAAPLPGVQIHRVVPKLSTETKSPWAQDFETKLIRGEAAFNAAIALRKSGFHPDAIVGHMGWGDTLFLKDVWPAARLGVYCEFFYRAEGGDTAFDHEFQGNDRELPSRIRVKLKTLPQRLHFAMANAGISPTSFQADTYPDEFRKKITVIHDGVDTDDIKPRAGASITLGSGRRFTAEDEIVTFVARNLEPYRGYHIFMRSLPELLRQRPKMHVFLVGGNGVGYGSAPPRSNWRDLILAEVRGALDLSRVHFVGTLDHDTMLELLSISRAHVYLTYPFVLSWSLIEAMALGAPIVASSTAPVREVIEHNEEGLLVDFFDRRGLTEQICRLLDSEDLRSRLGKAARAKVVRQFDLKRVCLPQQIAWTEALVAQEPMRPLFE